MANPEHLEILKQGGKAWNFWRLRHKDVCPKLGRAELSHVGLTAADLSHADLGRAILCRADLSGADFREADLTHSDLSGSLLVGADFSRAISPARTSPVPA